MAHFITSESGTVSRRAGLSFSWIAVALVAVGLLVAAPSYPDDNCAPTGSCFGIACNTCGYTGCWTYGGCNMPQKRQEWYCNWPTTGCTWSGYRCYECD